MCQFDVYSAVETELHIFFHIFFTIFYLCITLIHSVFHNQTPPTAEEAGYCDNVYVDEIGDTSVIIFKQGKLSDQTHFFDYSVFSSDCYILYNKCSL